MIISNLQQQLKIYFPAWDKLTAAAAESGRSLYLVGGALRDLFSDRKVSDLDFVCPVAEMDFWEATVLRFNQEKGRFITMGNGAERHSARRLVGPEMTIDIAALNGPDLESDLKLRDFTINAMAFALKEQSLYDPHAGLKALKERKIISVAPENMQNDPLRIVRAARFMLMIDGELTAATRAEMEAACNGLDRVAKERFTVEMNYILAGNQAGRGLRELAEVGALQKILPPLAPLAGLEQNNFHHLDVLNHTLAVIDSLDGFCQSNPLSLKPPVTADRVLLKWAALLHDTGKALSKSVDPDTGTIHFFGHERFSAHLARETLAGFALGKGFLNRIVRLIENHLRCMLLNLDNCKEKALRRLVFDLEDDLDLLLLHALADLDATRGRDPQPRQQNLIRLSRRLKEIYEVERETFIKPLISGKDLIALGLEPGPAIGTIIRMIHQKQLAGDISSKDEALAAAKLLL